MKQVTRRTDLYVLGPGFEFVVLYRGAARYRKGCARLQYVMLVRSCSRSGRTQSVRGKLKSCLDGLVRAVLVMQSGLFRAQSFYVVRPGKLVSIWCNCLRGCGAVVAGCSWPKYFSFSPHTPSPGPDCPCRLPWAALDCALCCALWLLAPI